MHALSARPLTAFALVALVSLSAQAAAPEKAFVKAAKQNDKAGMVAAAEAMADAPSKKTVSVLLKFGGVIESIDVYTACTKALAAAVSKPDLLPAIEKGLKSKRLESRTICVDALGAAGVKEGVPGLSAALNDKEKSVRISAIQGLTRLQLKESVMPLVKRLGKVGFKSKDAEAEELYASLFKLTGQAFEVESDWGKWWETVQADFDPKTRKKSRSSGTRMRDKGNEGKIFESVVRSQAFVLVLDISSSMRVIDLPPGESWKDKKGKTHKYKDPDPKATKAPHKYSRFTRAKEAFVKFIEGMSQRAQFAIVVFGEKKDVRYWKPKAALVSANPKNKKSAIDFIKGLKWSASTRTDLALDLAFKVKGADTIYLFSDGIPEKMKGGKGVDIPQDEVVEKARTLNRVRKVRLNCYGMTTSNKTRAFLTRLATENGGEYKDIRAPAKK